MDTVRFIGAASGWGARDRRCEAGPDVLRHRYHLLSRLQKRGIPVAWETTVRPSSAPKDAVTAVQDVAAALSRITAEVVAGGGPFVVLGGDHSCAVGTWSGVSAARRGRNAGPWGLLWIDAHMDSHIPETSPSGAVHGMPLACLLGQGDPRLTTLSGFGPKLLPAQVVLMGVRSFEPEEYRLLQRLGVKIYFMEEVRRRGLGAALHEALEVLRSCPGGFGLSVDLDALDPQDAPAVGTPVPGGIAGSELVAALRELGTQPGWLGMEIAEYNPALDRQGRTAFLIRDLLTAVFFSQRVGYEPHHRARESVLRA